MPDRQNIVLTDRELAIAAKAAELALKHVYAEVGKTVLSRLLWIVGAAATAAFVYFSRGKIG